MPKKEANVRGPYQKLSELRKGIIIGLYKSGMIVANIAAMENVSRYTITRIIDKYKKTGSVVDNKSPGRPKLLSRKELIPSSPTIDSKQTLMENEDNTEKTHLPVETHNHQRHATPRTRDDL